MMLKLFTSTRGSEIEQAVNDWLVAVPAIRIEKTDLRVTCFAEKGSDERPLIVLAVWYKPSVI
jgi:hypothetical protein